MRRTVPVLIAGVLLLLAAGVARAGPRYVLKVDGLACPFCAYGIEKALRHTAGVEDINIDINAGLVTVTMADGVSLREEAARRIVKDAGFALRGFEETEPAADADAGR